MRYRNFGVYGAQRSGNNYLAALIAQNFWNKQKYLWHHRGHKLACKELNDDYWAVFYIWRNFDDMARSLFNIQHKFGLHAATLDDFKTRPMSEFWFDPVSDEITATANFRTRSKVIKGATPLCGIDGRWAGTLREYWMTHINWWTNLKAKNLMIVSYDRLCANFNEVLLEIAQFLGSPKREFENVNERVGYFPIAEVTVSK